MKPFAHRQLNMVKMKSNLAANSHLIKIVCNSMELVEGACAFQQNMELCEECGIAFDVLNINFV